MKKCMLLLAILMMSEIVYGQKEPKLLWEREFGNVSESYLQTGAVRTFLRVSPLENTLAFSGEAWSIFNKDGNTLWKSSDFGIPNSLSLTDSLINWVGNKDSVTFFNGNYQVVGKIIERNNQNENYQIYKVDDGILLLKKGMITKYDFNIKELWRYMDSTISQVTPTVNQKSFYQFFTNENSQYSYLILSSEGKKILQLKSSIQIELLQIQDKRFWISSFNYADIGKNNFVINEFNLSKYDSTGKLLVALNNKDISPNSETIYNRPIFFPDGSLVVNHQIQASNKLSFTKIDKYGDKKQIDKNMNKAFLLPQNVFNLKMINDNEFMFVVGNHPGNLGAFSVFGLGNFESNSDGWITDINQKNVEMCKDGFLAHYNYSDELKFYNIGSSEKWNYKLKPVGGKVFGNFITFFEDNIYVNQVDTLRNNKGTDDSFRSLLKIRLLNGEELWKQANFSRLFFDEKGNHYLSNQFSQIKFIPKLEKVASDFFTYPQKSAGYYAGFAGTDVNFRDKALMTITLEKIENNNYKSILRKYSTQDSYDLSVRCAEKLPLQIQIDDKSEDCPAVKVKLSTPKREGIAYQWQKDGKELPNKINEVYQLC